MADTAAKTTKLYVQDGQPSADPAVVPPNGLCQFINEDTKPYLIELWSSENTHHPAMCVILPKKGKITLYADPNDQTKTKVYYNLLQPGHKTTIKSGSHGIIVGSLASKKSEAA
jgi:hypothetical protein